MTTTASVNGDAIAPRIAYAAKCLSTGRTNGRSFDSCFENYDGDIVLFALYRRSLRNPKLAAAMERKFTPESLAQCRGEFAAKWGNLRGRELEAASQAMRLAAQEAFRRTFPDVIY